MQAARGTPLNPGATNDITPTPTDPPLKRGAARVGFLSVFAIAYATDVITKILAVEKLTGRPDVELIGSFLTLHLVRNPGAAFSTGTRFTVALTCLAIVAGCVVVYFGWRARSRLWVLGLGLLLGGVLGNLTDRLFRDPGPFRGHVVDFLRLPNWPVFNVADICINVAAVIIVIQAFRGVRVDGTREAQDSVGDPQAELATGVDE
jgi:signal peptidase II